MHSDAELSRTTFIIDLEAPVSLRVRPDRRQVHTLLPPELERRASARATVAEPPLTSVRVAI